MNGPSVTLGLPPEKRTRAPVAGGRNPSSPSRTPALVRESLYFVILATRSAGGAKSAPAFSYPFGITSIIDRKSTRLNSSHGYISYAVFCLKKKKNIKTEYITRIII